jgi:hypothetical protein
MKKLFSALTLVLAISGATQAQTKQATVVVSTNLVGSVLTPFFLGFSIEKQDVTVPYDFLNPINTNLVALYRLLGPGLLRLGGNAEDSYTVWQDSGPGGEGNYNSRVFIEPPDVDHVAAFLRATGWKTIWGVASGIHGNGNATLAAAEIGYVASNHSDVVYGYAFVNEPDLMGGYGGYRDDWIGVANAVKAVVPDAPLTGPDTACPPDFGRADQALSAFLLPFASDMSAMNGPDGKPLLSLITKHWYYGPGGPARTVDMLLNTNLNALISPHAGGLPGMLDDLHNAVLNPGAFVGSNLPPVRLGYRLTEANSYYNGGSLGDSSCFGAGLWAIDFLFLNALHNSGGVNFHGGQFSYYSPIHDDWPNSGKVLGVWGVYYGMLAFSRTISTNSPAQLVESVVTNSSGLNFAAYAVKRQDGSMGLCLSNKDKTNTFNVTVALPETPSQASAMLLTAPPGSLPNDPGPPSPVYATNGLTLGGSPVGVDGGWHPTSMPVTIIGKTLSISVPPGSAQIVQVQTSKGSAFRIIAADGKSKRFTWYYNTTHSGETNGFRVYRSTNLISGAWQLVASNLTRAANGTNMWTDMAPPASPHVYYKPAVQAVAP